MASSKINVQSVQLESFALKLRNRKTFSSHNLVMDTVMLIKQLLGSKRFTSPENVISYLEKLEGPLKRDQRIGRYMICANALD